MAIRYLSIYPSNWICFAPSSVKIWEKRGHCPPPPPSSAIPVFQGNWSWKKSDNVDVSLSSSISGFGLVGQDRKSETDIKDRLFFFIFISLGSTVYIYLYNSWNCMHLLLNSFFCMLCLVFLNCLFSLFELFVVLISCCELYATWYQKFVTTRTFLSF